jgi:hypothetical protein
MVGNKMMTLSLALSVLLSVSVTVSTARAESAAAPTKAPAAKGERKKNIEFEDGFVEGMKKGPGDYASKATKWRDKKKDHLYRKEISFERDLDESLREMRYTQ